MKTHISSALVALLLTLAATAPLTAADGHSTHSGSMMPMLDPLKGKEFDVMYLQMMIHHHMSGIEMADLVDKNSERPELKTFAKQIINDQKKEITQMKEWLKEFYNEGEGKPMKDEKMQQEMAELEKLKGSDFDKKFLTVMSEHHKGALAMAELAKTRGTRKEVQEMSAEIIKKQTKEIDQMTDWSKSWF